MSQHSERSFPLLAVLVWAAAAIAGDLPAQPLPALEPPQRALWSRNDLRFQRHWLAMGPLATAVPDESGLHPSQNDSAWRPVNSWSDVIDVAGGVGAPTYRGMSASSQVAYLYTTVTHEQPGDVELSFASSERARIWVNGAPVHEVTTKRRLALDEDRVRVHFKGGENSLLIRTEHASGAWTLALRVLEPGTILPPPRLTPSIVSESATGLKVSTDIAARAIAKPVTVSIVGAGGHLIAAAEATRGQDVSFEKAKWPQGPYEIRLETTTAWNEPDIAHIDAYNGDAQSAGLQLQTAARSAPNNTFGATVRMLADMVLERIGGSIESAADDGWSRIASPLMEYDELLLDQGGKVGSVRPWGFVRIAYPDDTDGSTQYCRAYLPPDYSPSKPAPAVLFLHGYNPPNPRYVGWWSVADRHSESADRQGIIYIEPHARGNSQYLGIGEQDVLRCLDAAKRRLAIDVDRTYLAGESMGGSGTWIIASRHPDLFAAMAATHGGWDYRIVPALGFDNPAANRPLERLATEMQSSFVGIESLLNLPILIRHGDQDQAVSVEYSRLVSRTLARWGYDVRYDEIPGLGHEDLGLREANIAWLLKHRRVQPPRHVRVRALDLEGASAYWLRVDAWQEPMQVMRADAEVTEPGVVRIDTQNVAAATLALPPELRGKGPALRVVWNGIESQVSVATDGRALLSTTAGVPRPGDKRRSLEGRLSSLFNTPFAIVIGTVSPDPRMQGYCRSKGLALAAVWNAWQHETPRVFDDRDVTPEIEHKYSLLLIGGVTENRVTATMSDRLPLKVAADGVTIDGRRFPATNAYVQMIYPSPSAPSRYVLVIAPTSTDGMYFWNPATYWDQVYGFPNATADWSIIDGRRVTLDYGLRQDRGWVASGIFDRSWRRDDRWVFAGDAELRGRSPLRHAPSTNFLPSAATLEGYAGTYQIVPGINAVIAHSGNGLTLQAPGAPIVNLVAESETDFATAATANPISFERDAGGKVTGFALDYNGTRYHATRLP